MANFSPRSLRTALVVCCPPLSSICDRLASCFHVFNQDEWKPGSADVSICPSYWGIGKHEGAESFGVHYLFEELLSKLDDGKPSPAKTQATWARFHEAESLCWETNVRLSKSDPFGQYKREILLARKILSRILGPFSWDAAARYFSWGPGASTRLPRRRADAAYKYMGEPHTTISNAILADAAIRSNPLWRDSLRLLSEDEGVGYCRIVPGNRIVTVPKNYKTDRTIAIEPCMNMYIQKGIGTLIRQRLKAAGCDLDDQSRNQRLARVGSIAGTLATIDLSMASDCVSRSLVSLLVRPDWADAMEKCRSVFGVLPSGEKIFYQKFSSMGNGFTFELESAIFYALALAWCHTQKTEVSRVSVYGDDIIVPSAVAEGFSGLLSHVGFVPNVKKSYWTGPFRESCGKHYFNGHEITPFYVKAPPSTLVDLIKIHNQIYRFALRADWLTDSMRKELGAMCTWLRSYAPSKWRRPRLPDGYGDGAFIGTFDECVPRRAKGGLEGFDVPVILSLPVEAEIELPSLLIKSLSRLEKGSLGRLSYLTDPEQLGVYPVRGTRYSEGKILVRQFAHLSPFW